MQRYRCESRNDSSMVNEARYNREYVERRVEVSGSDAGGRGGGEME